MAGRLLRVAAVLTLGFAVVAVAMGYWQVLRARDLDRRQGNPRPVEALRTTVRGTIYDRHGAVLVENQQPGNRRVYHDPSLAQVIGYASLRYGRTDLEQAYDEYLSGANQADSLRDLWNRAVHHATIGDDLVLTIDERLQRAAAEALKGRRGALVALDPHTGEVLAMVSNPTYDPNTLERAWDALRADPRAPLFNRATEGLYPPGSTFKTVTLAAALESGLARPDTRFRCHGDWVVTGFHIGCNNLPPGSNGEYTLADAYAFSVNVTFGQLAVQLGAARFADYARRFGLDDSLPFDLPVAASRLAGGRTELPELLLAESGFGQGSVQVTPLEMALVAATVANDGVTPRPMLVRQVRRHDGTPLAAAEPRSLRQALQPGTAATVRQLMQQVVDRGSGVEARIPGVPVAGKTGTAETGSAAPPHAWFIAFAPADRPILATAVVLENAGEGSQQAAPVARAVLAQALGKG